jgi:hypothetical protein
MQKRGEGGLIVNCQRGKAPYAKIAWTQTDE